MATTAKGVPYPVGGDAPDGPTQIKAVADYIDAAPGIALLTYAQINALSGGALWAGRRVYQTDTGTNRPVSGEYVYNGVNWRLPWNMPWGEIAVATHGADTTGYTTYANITGLSVTFTAVANRVYVGELDFEFSGGAGADGAYGQLWMDGATQLNERAAAAGSSGLGSVHVPYRGTLAAGSHTIVGRCQRVPSDPVTINITGSSPTKLSILRIRDDGPAGIPT